MEHEELKEGGTSAPTCAPKPEGEEEYNFTCYSSESLERLKLLWNKRHQDNKIESNDPRKIWRSLKNNLRGVCKSEACWMRQSFAKSGINKEMENYTFATPSPVSWRKNPNEWLNSLDITNVMSQYEHAYPSFMFLGPSPIDYDQELEYGECVWDDLCRFNLSRHLRNGKTKIGVIFNTDPHDKPGAHWISLFIDTRQKFIFFFDSTGMSEPDHVKRFIKTVTDQGEEAGITFRVIVNDVVHQKKDTECGVYSLFMIIHLLTGEMKPEDFLDNSKRMSDKYMERFRAEYFNVDDITKG